MNNIQLAMQRQQLHSRINTLDMTIAKLSTWFNCNFFKSGSVMLSGLNELGKTFHDIVVFNQVLPLPVEYFKQFAESYCSDLIAERNLILAELDILEKSIQPQ